MPAGKPPNNFAFDGAAKDKVDYSRHCSF